MSDTPSTLPDTTQTPDLVFPRMYAPEMQEDGPHSPAAAWRVPLPQLARRSTPFRHLPDKELAEIHHAAQDAATAGAIKYLGFSTVRAAIDNLKYLWFTKWTQSSNPIDDWEIQDSGNWTTPPNSTCSSSTLASSLTTPSDLNFSDDSMDISSTRPTSPADTTPAPVSTPTFTASPFSAANPAKILVTKEVTVTEEDEDGECESDDAGEYVRARLVDAPNPYLKPSAPTQTYATWGSPPPSPSVGNDMQPPKKDACGPRPGIEWLYNAPGEVEYFRFLIPNPYTHRMCVAPWLKYSHTPLGSTVSATFGADYQIYKRDLRPTPVDYVTRTLTPQETRLFNAGEEFTTAVDFILQHAAPFDIVSGVNQYRILRDSTNALNAEITQKQERFMQQLERTMEVLSELENADAFNRLVQLKDTCMLEMSPYYDSMEALNTFLDTLPDQKHRPIVPEHLHAPPPAPAPPAARIAPTTKRVPLRTIGGSSTKRCYKCGGKGHIRSQCSSPFTTTTYLERESFSRK
jgi:hypothetical protein